MSSILKERKRSEALSDRITLAVTPTQKERYMRLHDELKARNFDSLNELTRERLDCLLAEVERELDCAVRVNDAC